MKLCVLTPFFLFISFWGFLPHANAADAVGRWMRYEKNFLSSKSYQNPLYELESFTVTFTSPTGRTKTLNGFWDGEQNWKVRFAPDELGTWQYVTACSDESNTGLHGVKGTFHCQSHQSTLDIYRKGAIGHPQGSYHLAHADGTPFFWAACTAWNGALKSTDEEWNTYLADRARSGYSVIQFVTTQWRGCAGNSAGQVAFQGSGRISLNVDFFRALDKKVDQINGYGLVAAPVLLWALPSVRGRELSPGYYLPDQEAAMLARYMVARYGGHHVIWLLGGDGKYDGAYEQRWKTIPRLVFGEGNYAGLVATHPQGKHWIGELYAREPWLDVIGYQSGHDNSARTVEWITKGPVVADWHRLPPRPMINMEPCYEEIHFKITDKDVRNASYWSLFSAPMAGITYGANGIWPWLREGEEILNHEKATGTHTWRESIQFPGSRQIGYLARFIRQLEWWRFRPAQALLLEQPGAKHYNHFVSLMKTEDSHTLLAYVPEKTTLRIANQPNYRYEGQWFNPVSNQYLKARLTSRDGVVEATSPATGDLVLMLQRK